MRRAFHAHSKCKQMGRRSAALLSWARETEFFALSNSGGWLQPYGKFFLEW